MAWRVRDDERFYETARRLQHAAGPRWVVFWGPASRRYWAFLRGAATSLILSAPDPHRLYDDIRRHTPRSGAAER